MEYFLPIAEVTVNLPLIFFLSLGVGILSGLFGVGGGFLMTPFLIFLGIPPSYAVPNEANNILGTSVSGSTTHYLKGTLDYKMGLMIVVGGTAGTLLGILTFTYFKDIGKINILISLAYMYILAIIGTMMLVQGVTEIERARKKIVIKKKLHDHYWIHGLPLRMRFKKSRLYESALTPILIGLIVGFIAAIMGVGGAFILVPAMIYIIGMPTKLVPGTSLFVTIFISAIVTILHAFNYGSIDLILVTVLIFGSILGVQVGQKVGEKVDSSQFKTILAVLLLLVGVAIAYDTFFAEETTKILTNDGAKSFGPVSQFVRDLSKNVPILYGMFSIVLALVLGVGAAILRKILSNLRKKFIPSPPASQK
ncbi:MAG: permease [Candidatus Pelagibacter sp. TMED273]|nr:MAG: permease [Candidatus Pelagibacter sp. TMED273]|tara:strand:+ start:263 stop:1357 length:1095 start_codon:yes stop_codon:yes gene_type:complete